MLVGRGFPFSSTSGLWLPELPAIATAKNSFLSNIHSFLIKWMGFKAVWLLSFNGISFHRVPLYCCAMHLKPLTYLMDYACALFTLICATPLSPKGFLTWNPTNLPENERQKAWNIDFIAFLLPSSSGFSDPEHWGREGRIPVPGTLRVCSSFHLLCSFLSASDSSCSATRGIPFASHCSLLFRAKELLLAS